MFFKSLLAATIVTVSAVVYQVKHVPARDFASQARQLEQAQAATPPRWITEPGSFFNGQRQDLLFATGSAMIRTSESLAHNQALLKARMNLVKAQGTAQGSTRVTSTQTLPSGATESTTRSTNPTTVRTTRTSPGLQFTEETVDGQLQANTELARWISPDGVLWVLVATGR